MKAFDEVLAEVNQEEVFQPFAVTDLETATEASRRIAYFEDKKSEIDTIIEKQIAPFLEKIEKIKAWGEEAKKEHVDKQEHYSVLLESYLRNEVQAQLESGKKAKKTIKLPFASISLRKQEPEFVRDNDLLLIYAKDAEKVKVTADWAAIKKTARIANGSLIDENGEVIPGVEAVEREDKFNIKLEG